MKTRPEAALRRAAFVQALGRHGNVAHAARSAGATAAAFYAARKRDARFAGEWDAALVAGRAAVAAGIDARVGDTAVWGAASGRAQLRQIAAHRWTARVEAEFLAALAAECSVTKAAHAVGFSTNAAYHQRQVSPEFRAGWGLALDEAMARLAMKLARQAMNGIDRGNEQKCGGARIADENEDRPIEDTHLAMTVLKEHHARKAGTRRPGRSGRRIGPDIETVKARVLAQIAVIKRTRGEGE